MDVAAIVNDIMPYALTAIGGYGSAVLTRAEDAAADASLVLGQRVLQRVLHRHPNVPALEAAVAGVAADPQDAVFHAALRDQILRLLATDSELTGEIAKLLPSANQGPTASGERAVAVQSMDGSVVITGDRNQVRR